MLNSEKDEAMESMNRIGMRPMSQEAGTKKRLSELSATKANHQLKEVNAVLGKANWVSGTKTSKHLDFRKSEGKTTAIIADGKNKLVQRQERDSSPSFPLSYRPLSRKELKGGCSNCSTGICGFRCAYTTAR